MVGKLWNYILPAAFLLAIQSCEKLDFRSIPPQPITTRQEIDTLIPQDASFSRTLLSFSPACTSQITTQAQHAGVSKLSTDADGNATYQYTPTVGFSGYDSVVITMTGAQNNGTNPNTDGKETIITAFKITVQGK